jgi:hypothetical protein
MQIDFNDEQYKNPLFATLGVKQKAEKAALATNRILRKCFLANGLLFGNILASNV